ncbi:hypothetical protein Purlil1_11122 [Purpureocillium lilacinum]|uniref:Uncharacterized protein n=1 Tax=Purpureocillium lilacinum TaxID=33203 RepID=A0ABR0BKF6_PURLI|nr:hypothetical protein Purlil1_11122 [Purpureocillium lilacinum]
MPGAGEQRQNGHPATAADCPEASAKVSSTVCSARGPWEGPRRATVLPRLQSLEFFFFFSHLFARSGCFPIPVHGDTRKCVPNGTVAVQRRIDHGLAFSSAIERTPPPSGSRQPLAAPHGWNPPPPAAGPLPRRHAPPAQGASTTTSAPPARQHQREHLTTNLDSEALGTRHNRATAPTGSPAPSAQATAAPRLAPPIAHAPPQSGTASPITLTPTKLDPSRQPSSLPDPYQIWVALPLHQRSNSRAAANRSKSSPPPLAASEPLPPPPPPPPPLSHTPSVLYRSIAPTHELLDLPSSSPSPSPCALQTSLCARPLPCLVARVFRPSRLPLASKPPPPPDSSG